MVPSLLNPSKNKKIIRKDSLINRNTFYTPSQVQKRNGQLNYDNAPDNGSTSTQSRRIRDINWPYQLNLYQDSINYSIPSSNNLTQ